MKTKILLTAGAFAAISSLCSCTDDDFSWDEMKWKTDVEMTETENGGSAIQVSADGGSYILVCSNYPKVWIDGFVIDGRLITELQDVNSYEGEWGNVKIEDNKVMVTILPEAKNRYGEIRLTVTAGDIFDEFCFRLNK